jgi:hypothetical protein
MRSERHGRLHIDATRTSAGKHIDTWHFVSPFPKIAHLEVKVFIFKSGTTVHFEAKGPQLVGSFTDTDIQRLATSVEDALRIQHDLITGAVWEDWLEVCVRGSHEDARFGIGRESRLDITYKVIKRGVYPANGTAYTLSSNGVAVEFPKPKQANVADENVQALNGFRFGDRELESEYSYLPATPENRAALDELMAKLESLRHQLSGFLRQDVVAQSLSGRAASLQLTTPVES